MAVDVARGHDGQRDVLDSISESQNMVPTQQATKPTSSSMKSAKVMSVAAVVIVREILS